jgi:uncharacterized protein YcbK (DUF882 family)
MTQAAQAHSRRRFLRRASHVAALAVTATALPMIVTPARASSSGERRLAFVNTHTRERLALAYAVDGRYVPEALGALDRLLRDHYSGEVGRIDPGLFDLLHRVQQELAHDGAFEIISGFRSGATNARLRERGGGGVARRSLHLQGRAIDLRLPGVALADLRDAALSLRGGGVGFYAREQFVHLDTGRVRTW